MSISTNQTTQQINQRHKILYLAMKSGFKCDAGNDLVFDYDFSNQCWNLHNKTLGITAMVTGEAVENVIAPDVTTDVLDRVGTEPCTSHPKVLCTCAECNTDIDCAVVAASVKNHDEYEREVHRLQEERSVVVGWGAAVLRLPSRELRDTGWSI